MSMLELKNQLNKLNEEINLLENNIEKAKIEAEENIKLINTQILEIKENKRKYALKNDFESVQQSNSKIENLKFKINAQWNKYSLLNEELNNLKKQKNNLLNEIKLKEDKNRRNNQIRNQMDKVLTEYKKTHELKKAAIDSNISYETVQHWFDWGKNNYNQTTTYFYNQIREIDDYFKQQEKLKLRKEMDQVIEAYKKTHSLKEASADAGVSYNTVKYWFDWGKNKFGDDNYYFYTEISKIV